ncbi:MAG: hypothetical protein HYU66_23975 [Armatimonadetes bacterium]|nr:hypothetical protein [Armatimonadota bacterium]
MAAWAVALVLLDVLLAGWALTPLRPARHDRLHMPLGGPMQRLAVGAGRVPRLLDAAPNSNLRFGQSNVYNMSPLSLARQVALFDLAREDPTGQALHRLWQRLGVRFAPEAEWPYTLEPAPEAWAVRRVTLVSAAEAATATLRAPLEEAVLVAQPEQVPRPGQGNATLLRAYGERPNRSSYELDCPDPELIVLSESAYPGRHAWVDQQPTRLWRANNVQTAVELPAGQHTIVVAWNPMSLRLGEFLWLLTLSALAAAVGRKP